jgi:hypothetical protein
LYKLGWKEETGWEEGACFIHTHTHTHIYPKSWLPYPPSHPPAIYTYLHTHIYTHLHTHTQASKRPSIGTKNIRPNATQIVKVPSSRTRALICLPARTSPIEGMGRWCFNVLCVCVCVCL